MKEKSKDSKPKQGKEESPTEIEFFRLLDRAINPPKKKEKTDLKKEKTSE
jgi:hypothetical protein